MKNINKVEIARDALIKKAKEEYVQGDVVMSEFLRGCDDLSIADARELLRWSGEDDLVTVLENGNIESKEVVFDGIVTGLNQIVEAYDYCVEVDGFGYTEDGLSAVCGDDIIDFNEGLEWLIDELTGVDEHTFGKVLIGLNMVLSSLGIDTNELCFTGVTGSFGAKISFEDLKNSKVFSLDEGMEFLNDKFAEMSLIEPKFAQEKDSLEAKIEKTQEDIVSVNKCEKLHKSEMERG